MSDNGPYGQPPQGGGGHGQPHFQSPYGTGPQPGPPGGPGQPGQPGGPQQMYSGGPGQPPPYGPGGPGAPVGSPGYPPPKKSSAGMWIVIGGGVVILLLVVAVVVMLIRGGETEGGGPVAEPSNKPEESTEQTTEGGGGGEEEGGGGPKGEPPYALPEDPCSAFTEATAGEYGLKDGSKSLTDTSSSCMFTAESLGGDGYANVSVRYQVPYGGSDSIEGAKSQFQENVEYATDESSDIIPTKVHENEELNLGEEAAIIFSTQEIAGTKSSVATVLIREGNINAEVEFTESNAYDAPKSAPAPLKFDDVESMMNDLGNESLSLIGS